MVGRVAIKKEPAKVVARRVDGHESSPCPSTASEHSLSSSGEKRKVPMDDLFPGDRDKRRKLMNRVAAQQSRDRKKQHFDELEAEVKRLRSENATLLSKNSTIIKEKDDLRVENEDLKKQLAVLSEKKDVPAVDSTAAQPVGEENGSASEISSSVAFESAAGTSHNETDLFADAIPPNSPHQLITDDFFNILEEIWMDISAGAHQEPCSAEPASQEGSRVLLPDNRTLEKQTAEQLDSLKEFLQWEAVDSSTSSGMLDSTMVSVLSPIITIPEIYPSSPSSSVSSESQLSPCSLTPMSNEACSASEDFLLEDAMLGIDVDHLLRTFISVA